MIFLFPDNALAGAIPTEVGQLAQLERLALGFNQLTGTPKKTSLIAKWYSSKPSDEKRSITKIAGPIPTELGRCSAMNYLNIRGNQLSGMSLLCSSGPVWFTSIPTSKYDLVAAQATFRRNSDYARHCRASG